MAAAVWAGHIVEMDVVNASLRFRSGRERTLWLLVAAVVVAIYSTLGLATTLAAEFTDRDMLDNVAAVALLSLFGVVVLAGLKGRSPNALRIAIAVGVVAVYALVFLRAASPIERSHLFEYSLVAILIYHALVERRRNGRRVPFPAGVALVATLLLGWIDEVWIPATVVTVSLVILYGWRRRSQALSPDVRP